MSEEELKRIEQVAQRLQRPAISYWYKQLFINGCPVATFVVEAGVANDVRDGLACLGRMLEEIRRLRTELDGGRRNDT